MPDGDWALHGIVLGVLAAIGAVVTLIAYLAPSRSAILPLGPIVALFLGIGFGIYAVASTILLAAFPAGRVSTDRRRNASRNPAVRAIE